MRSIRIKPALSVDSHRLCQMGISQEEFSTFFPRYLRETRVFECGSTMFFLLHVVQLMIQTSIKLFLRPRIGSVGKLHIKEVEEVYNREAVTYDAKHHLTTHGIDATWRRLASWSVVTFGCNNSRSATILDLCTGTGLTIQEIGGLLYQWGIRGSVIGLDYNAKMLNIASARNFDFPGIEVGFVRGNAMDLVKGNNPGEGLTYFGPNSFDVVTQMFGIGGISEPVLVFQGVLQILKNGGQFFMIDMHQPIHIQPGEWPFLWKWFRFPRLEAMTYEQTTIPLALNRLWGWRDTTLDFYLLPLVTWQDEYGDRWGFRVISFEVESQRWWLNLPIMPVGKIIAEKVMISEEECMRRQKILSLVTN